MNFQQRDADDVFGTSELVLLNDDGSKTAIEIADLRDQGSGFVVFVFGDEWQRAETLDEAKQIALHVAGA